MMGPKTTAGAPERALIKALRQQLEASLLPGDAPPPAAALDEATSFLLAAARTRAPGQSLVQIESASEGRRHLRIAIVNADMPFLVDSIAATFASHGVGIDLLLHPVIPVMRDAEGTITALAKPGAKAEGQRESLIYCETPRVDARQRRELLDALQTTLGDVHAAVGDWPQLQAVMGADRALAEAVDGEAGALLGWLNGGHSAADMRDEIGFKVGGDQHHRAGAGGGGRHAGTLRYRKAKSRVTVVSRSSACSISNGLCV
jgi:glutamate dehydrogenase